MPGWALLHDERCVKHRVLSMCKPTKQPQNKPGAPRSPRVVRTYLGSGWYSAGRGFGSLPMPIMLCAGAIPASCSLLTRLCLPPEGCQDLALSFPCLGEEFRGRCVYLQV